MKWAVRQYRNHDDFMFGSFDIYVTEKEIVIRGRLKRGTNSLYMMLTRTE